MIVCFVLCDIVKISKADFDYAIALKSGSSYDSLNIEYNAQGNYTNVSEETGELIATLIGVEANHLTESNFTTI